MDIRINILNQQDRIPPQLIEASDGDELVARIFYNRGYRNPGTVRQMLHEELYNPMQTSEFPLMEKAVDRIVKAIENKEKIAVYGDYDVDGVTSTVTLVQCLNFFTSNVVYHVPDRFTEGYGMNEEVIRRLAESGVSLVITCDCGISNINEIRLAKELGLSVIVTDHHNIPEQLPPADVVLNPKLLEQGHRARNISGCAMAYFLCLALLEHFHQAEKSEEFLDLLALSLVADVVSLNGENRYLLRKAIPKLFNTARPGLKALFSIIETDTKMETEEDIAFQIAPRINAAGRMESARMPVELFLSNDDDFCLGMAQKIDFLNKERKRQQQEMIHQAVELVESRKRNKTVLVLFNEFWHHGIIGIAAGKISEMYRKPAILLSMKEDGITAVGSARSVKEVDIYRLIKECGEKLLKFGGHPAAAGLSIKKEDIEEFTREIEVTAEKRYFIKDRMDVNVDMEMNLHEIDEDLYMRINSAGPYGEGFEAPVFVSRSVTVFNDRKTEKNHHIMILAGEKEKRMKAVKWFGENERLQDKTFDITYKIGRKNYKGNSELQLTVDYLLPVQPVPRDLFRGIILDCRDEKIDEVLKVHKNALVFYEGIGSSCPVNGAVDRNHITNCESVVLLSPPLNTAVFREIISLSNPSKVILNFSIFPDYTFKGFMLSAMGVIKHAAGKNGGKVQLDDLAIRLNIEENVLRAVFKYLKLLGKLEYSVSDEENSVHLSLCNRQPDRSLYAVEQKLKDALAEKNAYQQFVLKLEADKFVEYLK